jgi:hypothetical protein
MDWFREIWAESGKVERQLLDKESMVVFKGTVA